MEHNGLCTKHIYAHSIIMVRQHSIISFYTNKTSYAANIMAYAYGKMVNDYNIIIFSPTRMINISNIMTCI